MKQIKITHWGCAAWHWEVRQDGERFRDGDAITCWTARWRVKRALKQIEKIEKIQNSLVVGPAVKNQWG